MTRLLYICRSNKCWIGALAAIAGLMVLAAHSIDDARAVTPSPYDSHERVLVADGAGGVVFAPRATYRYSGLAFTPVATPTDIIQIQGSATKTLRITKLRLGGVATGQGNMPVALIKRSTAGTLGSAVLTAVTAVKLDTTDPAATGVVSTVGTANYTTLGTAVGTLGAGRLNMPAVGSGATTAPLEFSFGREPLRLRTTSEWLCINLNGAAVPAGGVIDWEIEIEEDNSSKEDAVGAAITNTLRNINPISQTIEATIPNGGALSEWLDLGERRFAGLIMPAAWTAANISFDVSHDSGTTAFPLFDQNGAEVVLTVAAGRAYSFPIAGMLAWRWIRLRSGASAAPVNQAADRLLRVMAEP